LALNVLTDQLKYLISFTRLPGIGRVKLSQLINHFSDLSIAWSASSFELKNAGLDSRTVSSIVNNRNKINPDEEIEKLSKYNVKAIPFNSPDYPEKLKEINDYPTVLYIRGSRIIRDEICIAVVGTRRPTVYGKQVTEDLVSDLATNNITIISGLASGIDSIAHRSALSVGKPTFAVFASGLDIVYPADNLKLAKNIMQNGALISEYPLGIKPKAENFPRRNRIMSGISAGVLVIEAGEKSGALITADQALLQNREVFAVPGSILSPMSKGTNYLIQQGAKLVSNYMDVMEELNLAVVAQQIEMKEFISEDENEILILKQLKNEPIYIDEICRLSGLPISIVNSTMSVLEIKGMVRQVGHLNFVLSRNIS
jgi:DNA processing protein